jgi:hypothetical protein
MTKAIAWALVMSIAACGKKQEQAGAAAAPDAASAATSASAPAPVSAAVSGSVAGAESFELPPKPTEPVPLGEGASYFDGTKAADAIADVRARAGGALRLLDLHVYPARIVLKAKEPNGDAIQRWEIRATGVIGPKTEGLSAKKLDARLFDETAVPFAKLATLSKDAIGRSGLPSATITHVDVRRAKAGGVTMRFAVHSGKTTKWIDVDATKP